MRFSEDAGRVILSRKPALESLAFRDVARDAGKKAFTIIDEFTKRQFERNLFSVLMQSGKFNCLPRNVALSGFEIPFQATAVNVTEIVRHEHGERLPNHLLSRIAKNSFGCGINKLHRTLIIDGNDRVGRGLSKDARP